ncbi:hypothetical protein G7059_03835 [Erysipelothrix sp. HDW6A]|uniref:InlB B-repeat-containing protein n=1 Tax=Erysipelothrix sp. HDW6A TaxID=2714928 RepID=UPI001407A05E|nr:InlB B-repeat-containing protein [Erysipelothrix sp. HDW6A]QIK57038.1 hypothetical protein G7059_03835 [Erysipelothrix sp. HDW6A]
MKKKALITILVSLMILSLGTIQNVSAKTDEPSSKVEVINESINNLKETEEGKNEVLEKGEVIEKSGDGEDKHLLEEDSYEDIPDVKESKKISSDPLKISNDELGLYADETVVEVTNFNELQSALRNKSENILITDDIVMTSSITINSNVNIKGNNGVKITGPALTSQMFDVSATVTNFKLQNLIVDGTSSGQSKALYFKSTTGIFVFENMVFKNFNNSQGSVMRFYTSKENVDDLLKIEILSSAFENVISPTGSYPAIEIGVNSEIKIENSKFNNNGIGGAALAHKLNYTTTGSNHKMKLNIASSSFNNFGSKESGGAITLRYRGVDGDINITNSTFTSNNTTESNGQGGAVSIVNDSRAEGIINLNITQSKFEGNISEKSMGGALYAERLTNVIFSDVVFNNNNSYTQGGAVVITSLSDKIKTNFVVNGAHNIFNGNRTTNDSSVGGALLIIGSVDTKIQNAEYKMNSSNQEGGAIDVTAGSSPEDYYAFDIENSKFLNNKSEKAQGGAVAINGKIKATFNDSLFESNIATSGGAIHVFQSYDVKDPSLTIENSNFKLNEAKKSYGGAIGIQNNYSYNTSISNTNFESNKAVFGGAIYMWLLPQTNALAATSNLDLLNVKLSENTAYQGGAISTSVNENANYSGDTPEIKVDMQKSVIDSNKSESNGGGIFLDSFSSFSAIRSQINNNATTINGGGIYFVSTPTQKNELVINDSVIQSNHAGNNGGGINVSLNYDINANTSDEDYELYFKLTKLNKVSFINNTADNGGYILNENLYPKLSALAKTNLVDIQSLSSPFNLSNNSAYNNYDINFISDTIVEDVTIQYESNGGSPVNSETVIYNSKFTEPIVPTYEGFVFKGWYIDSSLESLYNFETLATENITVYAKWVKAYAVTYTDGVEYQEAFEDQVYSNLAENSSTPTFQGNPTREGYTFEGWLPEVAATVTGDATYVAQWKKIEDPIKEYTVTYTDGVEDEEVFANQVYSNLAENSSTPTFQGNPTREGYTFEGWLPEVAATVTGDATYVAQWKKIEDPIKEYTVTYTDGVEGEEVFANQVYSNLAENSSTPTFQGNPTREGYTFEGWLPEVAATVTGDATYVAQWKKIEESIKPIEPTDPSKPVEPEKPTLPETGVSNNQLGLLTTLLGSLIIGLRLIVDKKRKLSK